MSGIVLTAYPGSILGPVAKFLGWIMNGIYNGISSITGGRVESVVLSIVIVTIIIYMCLLPLTIKQQKFSKLSQKMQPEMQAIQAKYKNKKDQASMMAMQQETRRRYPPRKNWLGDMIEVLLYQEMFRRRCRRRNCRRRYW